MPRFTFFRQFVPGTVRRLATGIAIALLLTGGGVAVEAQAYDGSESQPAAGSSALPDAPQPASAGQGSAIADDKPPVTLRSSPGDIVKEQGQIWTSPLRVRAHNLTYLFPIALGSVVVGTVDYKVMSSSRLNDASLNNKANLVSQGLLGGFVAVPVAIFGLGHIHNDQHATETGILAGQAMTDSLLVDVVMKAASMRGTADAGRRQGQVFPNQRGAELVVSLHAQHCCVVIGGGDRLGILWMGDAVYRLWTGDGVERQPGGGAAAFPLGCGGRQRGWMADWAVCVPQAWDLARRVLMGERIDSRPSRPSSYTGLGFCSEKNLRWCQ